MNIKNKTSSPYPLNTITKYYLKFILFGVLFLNGASGLAQTKSTTLNLPSSKILKVGVAGNEPFVFKKSEKGIAVEIWNRIAHKKSWDFKYVPFKTVKSALLDLSAGNIDLVVGPVSITSKRLEKMSFSQPYYNSSLSIISRSEELSLWEKFKPLLSFKLLMAVGVFLIILAFVGFLFWLAERKKSPDQFSHEPLKGVATGMWLAIVTMSTTGYGDTAPITVMGRVVAGAWMIISIIFATSMVAGIASTLSISNSKSTTVSNIEELAGRKTATVLDSPSEELLRKVKSKIIGVSNLEEAIEKLENKKVEAVVFDRPQLLYYLKVNEKEDFYISKAMYNKQNYGFAFPIDSKLISDVNLALLELSENLEIEEVIHNYIMKDE